MPSYSRSKVVSEGEVEVYHCWNRCVQRAFLCGTDQVTGKDYEYRRGWVEQTQEQLAGLFAVDIAFFGVLSNHIHVIVRTRPDLPGDWDDREVVRRWLCVTKLKRNGADHVVEPTDEEIDRQLRRKGRVDKLRRRLASVSWFMGTLCENISRRCNRDAGTSGAFWEHRFDCRKLADNASILICGIYVDLNQVRAGEALTPEESVHTSVYRRIQALKQRQWGGVDATVKDVLPADHWLCELSLRNEFGPPIAASSCPPTTRASNKGILDASLEEYLELLDWTGRQLHSDKPGAIPATLAPILDRLSICRDKFVDGVRSFDKFGAVVGSVSAVSAAAKRAQRKWFHGIRHCAELFG